MLRECQKRASLGREVGVTDWGVISAYATSEGDTCSHGERGEDVETKVMDLIFERRR